MTKEDKIQFNVFDRRGYHFRSHLTALDSFHLVATLKDFEIFHEFNYFVSLSAMISFGYNYTTLT